MAPLKTNSSVNITNVVSPDHFYVQRNDVFPQSVKVGGPTARRRASLAEANWAEESVRACLQK